MILHDIQHDIQDNLFCKRDGKIILLYNMHKTNIKFLIFISKQI